MPSISSREARSARRKALKSRLEARSVGNRTTISTGRVTKSAKSARKATKKTHTRPESKASKQKEVLKECKDQQPKADSKMSVADPKLSDSEKVEPVQEFSMPVKPVAESHENAKDPKDLEIPDLAGLTDEELQEYFREFEENSDLSELDDVEMPLTPEEDGMFELKPGFFEAYGAINTQDSQDSLKQPVQLPVVEQPAVQLSETPEPEIKLDEYITYDDTEPSVSIEEPALRWTPRCMFNNKMPIAQHTVNSSFNPAKRTLLAAWRTMAPDFPAGPRDVYIQSVLLAAASFNQRSMLSGCARQTLSPGCSASY